VEQPGCHDAPKERLSECWHGVAGHELTPGASHEPWRQSDLIIKPSRCASYGCFRQSFTLRHLQTSSAAADDRTLNALDRDKRSPPEPKTIDDCS
jgi:hypothetical protein